MSDIDNIDVGSQQDVVTTPSPASNSSTAPQPNAPAPENMLSQSRVNEIVQARLAEDRAKRQPESYQSQQHQQSQTNQMTPEQVKRLIDERAIELSNQETANRVMGEFANKVLSAVEKYPDYEQKVSQLDFRGMAEANPNLILVLNAVDNTGDVAYEMANNPGKFATVFSLAQTHPHLAKIELDKLSNSIKQNEAAKNQPNASEPLNRVLPTNIGTGNSSGIPNVRDEKANSKYRG